MESDVIHIYTDGACLGNPGPGGWGIVLLFNGRSKEVSGFDPDTTNNRMELTGPIEAIKLLKNPEAYIIKLYSDSEYLVKGMTQWLAKWKKTGWRGSKGPVKNVDLWLKLDGINELLSIEWIWVKGHADNEYNNRCDILANEAIIRSL